MIPPINQKHMTSLIGLLNYYRDKWAKLSHLLQPLTALMKKKEKWTPVEQTSFGYIKRIVTCDALLINMTADLHPSLYITNFSVSTEASSLYVKTKCMKIYSTSLDEPSPTNACMAKSSPPGLQKTRGRGTSRKRWIRERR